MSNTPSQQPLFIQANGLEFAYLEATPAQPENAPLVLCLHGFPDTAWSFQPLLTTLADAGYRAVAVFMRGYPPTALAGDKDYSALALGRDVLALIEHFGVERANIVGHDWGAVAAYAAAALRPDRIRRIVTAAVPHPRRFILRPSRAQLRASGYMFRFQTGRLAARRLARDDFAELRELVRSWSKDWEPGEDYWTHIKEAYAEPARLQAALRYYRTIPGLLFRREVWSYLFKPIQVPARVICGSEDGSILLKTFMDQAHLFAAGYELEKMKGIGHFMHLQAPEAFAELVLRGLGEHDENARSRDS